MAKKPIKGTKKADVITVKESDISVDREYVLFAFAGSGTSDYPGGTM